MTEKAKLIDALEKARHALVVCNACHATDRPDLPRVLGETEWIINNDAEIQAIDAALSSMISTQELDASNSSPQVHGDEAAENRHSTKSAD